ncbi:hypothetical protein SOVF_135970 [Spinacia oleracea]|nr:hypothetical protein SOVF_135970 [Spinacia oleracea]
MKKEHKPSKRMIISLQYTSIQRLLRQSLRMLQCSPTGASAGRA